MNPPGGWAALDAFGFQAIVVLLSILWQSSILLVAAAVITRLMNRRRAAARFAVWAGALAVVPLLPLLGWLASGTSAPKAEIPLMPAYTPPPVVVVERPAAAIVDSLPRPLPIVAEPGPVMPIVSEPSPGKADGTTVNSEPQTPAPSVLSYPWALGLVGYGVGAGFFLVVVMVGRMRIGWWVRRGRVVTDERVVRIFASAAERLGIERPVRLVEHAGAPSPLATGLARPVVLLPAGLESRLSDEELQAVALHELAHVGRRDASVLLALSCLRAVLFFHPLVWLASRQVSMLAEAACDDAVLSITGQPVPYARMLARLAEELPGRAIVTELAAGFVLSKGAFLARIEAILSHRREQMRRLSRLALAGTVIAAAGTVALALALPLGEKGAAEKAVKAALPGSAITIESALGKIANDAKGFAILGEAQDEAFQVVGYDVAGVYLPMRQTFKVVTSFSGNVKVGQSILVDFLVSQDKKALERTFEKHERVIWIGRENTGDFTNGLKALSDTPENRKAVAEALKAAGALPPLGPGELLPGHSILLADAVRIPEITVAVCEVLEDGSGTSNEKGVQYFMQKHKVLEVLAGKADAKEVLVGYIQYESRDPKAGERPVKKGEKVIWIVKTIVMCADGAQVWNGEKVLLDTPETRKAVAEALKAAGELVAASKTEKVAAALRHMASDDMSVRSQAAYDLYQSGPHPDLLPQLLDLFRKEKDEWVRGTLALALGQLGPAAREAVPGMIDYLRNPPRESGKTEVRNIQEALKNIGEPAVGPLNGALGDKDVWTRERAAETLGMMGPAAKPAVAGLEAVVKDSEQPGASFYLRLAGWEAAHALALIDTGNSQRAKALLPYMKDTDYGIRRFALREMGVDPAAKLVPEFMESLEDADGTSRAYAAEKLGLLGTKASQAIPVIEKQTTDKDPMARREARIALGMISTDTGRARRFLMEGMADTDESAAYGVVKGLSVITPIPVGDLCRASTAGSDAVRMHAVRELAECRNEPAKIMPVLVAALGDSNKWVRGGAAYVLRLIGPAARDAVPALKATLDDKDEWVRTSAIEALEAIDVDASRPAGIVQVRSVADLLKQPVIEVGAWRVRLGWADSGPDGGPWKLLYCWAEDVGQAGPAENRDPSRTRLGPVTFKVTDPDGPREMSELAHIEEPAQKARKEALYAAVVPAAWKGRYQISVFGDGGREVARTILSVDRTDPGLWQSLGRLNPAARDDRGPWVVMAESPMAVHPWTSGRDPVWTPPAGLKLADLEYEKGLPGQVPAMQFWLEPKYRTPPSSKLSEGNLTLSLDDGDLLIIARGTINTDADYHFAARWWVNGKPVPAAPVKKLLDEQARKIEAGMTVKLPLALPQTLGELKAGDKISLQVMYSPDQVRVLPGDRDQNRVHLLESIADTVNVPLLSNRLDFAVTAEMLKGRPTPAAAPEVKVVALVRQYDEIGRHEKEASSKGAASGYIMVDGRNPFDRERAQVKKELVDLGPAAVKVIHASLKDEKPLSRAEAVRFLNVIGGEEAVRRGLREVWPGKVEDPQAIKLLAAHCGDADIDNILVSIGEPAVAALVEETNRRNEDAVSGDGWRATTVLVRIGPSAVPALIELLETGPMTSRNHALGALKQTGDRRAVPAFIKTLQSKDAMLRGQAGYALASIVDPSAKDPLYDAVRRPENWNKDALFGIVQGVAMQKDERAFDTLVTLTGKDDWLVRRAAVMGLVAVGGKKALGTLLELTTDTDFRIRGDAAVALGNLGDRRAVPLLIERLKDKEDYVRSWSAWALGQIGDPAALPALREMGIGYSQNEAIKKIERPGPEVGSRLTVDKAMATDNCIVARCEALEDGKGEEERNGEESIQQKFKVIEIISGRSDAREVTISYGRLTSPGKAEATITKGTQLIWIAEVAGGADKPAGQTPEWIGRKALNDTTDNRGQVTAPASSRPADARDNQLLDAALKLRSAHKGDPDKGALYQSLASLLKYGDSFRRVLMVMPVDNATDIAYEECEANISIRYPLDATYAIQAYASGMVRLGANGMVLTTPPEIVRRAVDAAVAQPIGEPPPTEFLKLEQLSDMAQKVAAAMPAGWKVQTCGRSSAPSRWSGRTECEFIHFKHDMLKASFPPGPAEFTMWLAPALYAGRLYEAVTDQPGGAWLQAASDTHLMFIEGGLPEGRGTLDMANIWARQFGFKTAANRDITPAAKKTLVSPPPAVAGAAMVGNDVTLKDALAIKGVRFVVIAKAEGDASACLVEKDTMQASQWFTATEVLLGDGRTDMAEPYNYTYRTAEPGRSRPVAKGESVLVVVSREGSERVVVKFAADTPENRNAALEAGGPFVIELPGGRKFQVAPDMVKLPAKGGVLSPGRDSFERLVRESVTRALRQDPKADIGEVVFMRFNPPRAMPGQPDMGRSENFKIKDYARVTELKAAGAEAGAAEDLKPLLDRMAAVLPKTWEFVGQKRGKVTPSYWKDGTGVKLTWQRKGFKPEDIRGGGQANVWIMDADYAAKPPEEEGMQMFPADEIGKWHGRRVIFWGFAREWESMRTDVITAVKAAGATDVISDKPTNTLETGPAVSKTAASGLAAVSPRDRVAAIQALGQKGPGAAASVPMLVAMLDDDGSYILGDAPTGEHFLVTVSGEAAKALKQVTGQDFGPDAAKWRQWLKDNPPAVAELKEAGKAAKWIGCDMTIKDALVPAGRVVIAGLTGEPQESLRGDGQRRAAAAQDVTATEVIDGQVTVGVVHILAPHVWEGKATTEVLPPAGVKVIWIAVPKDGAKATDGRPVLEGIKVLPDAREDRIVLGGEISDDRKRKAAEAVTAAEAAKVTAARKAVEELSVLCRNLTPEQHKAAVAWTVGEGRQINDRISGACANVRSAGQVAAPFILDRLPAADKWERFWMIECLSDLADPRAVATFEQYAKGNDTDLRGRAFRGLSMGGPVGIPTLERLAGEKDIEVQRQTMHACYDVIQHTKDLKPEDLGRLVAAASRLRHDADQQVRWMAVTILGKGDVGTDPWLIEALEDKDNGIRETAMTAIKDRRQTSAIPAMMKIVQAVDPKDYDAELFKAGAYRMVLLTADLAGLKMPPLKITRYVEHYASPAREPSKDNPGSMGSLLIDRVPVYEGYGEQVRFLLAWWEKDGRAKYEPKTEK
jgi:HEAT repeat protein/beta-lactamase regulating signal transducer with metallopeptidase domain